MLQKRREITDKEEILEVLRKCTVLRVGFAGEEYPYVVPVNFGFRQEGDKVLVYFHGAGVGYKSELLKKETKVCIEADIFYQTELKKHGITTLYESVIGMGTVEQVEGEEKIRGLREITDHYGYLYYPLDHCNSLTHTIVYCVTLQELTGKRNKGGE